MKKLIKFRNRTGIESYVNTADFPINSQEITLFLVINIQTAKQICGHVPLICCDSNFTNTKECMQSLNPSVIYL